MNLRFATGSATGVALAICACTFSGPPGPAESVDGGGAELDAAADASIASMESIVCPGHTDLIACFRFEESGADDVGDHDATLINESYVGGAYGVGLALAPDTLVTLANSAGFEISAVTLEVWIGPQPSQGYVFDFDGRFSLRIYGGRVARCLFETEANGKRSAEAVIAEGGWKHVACVNHPISGVRIYVDEVEIDTEPVGGSLKASKMNPAHVGSDSPGGGSDFVGSLDNLRIWRRALRAGEICRECKLVGRP